MNMRWRGPMAAATVAVFWGGLFATAAEPSGQIPPPMHGSVGVIQTSTLIGTTVFNLHNQKLGKVKEILLDLQTGQAAFVALDAEGPAASHPTLIVPYQALAKSATPADNRPSLLLNLRPDQIGTAPQIKDNQWQTLQNPQFLAYLRSFYHTGTYTVARPIENVSPTLPPVQNSAPPAPYYVAPYVCQPSGESDMPQDLIDFYNE